MRRRGLGVTGQEERTEGERAKYVRGRDTAFSYETGSICNWAVGDWARLLRATVDTQRRAAMRRGHQCGCLSGYHALWIVLVWLFEMGQG